MLKTLLVFIAFLFSLATGYSQRIVIETVQKDSLSKALTGCQRSVARYSDSSGKSWPCYLAVDQKRIFYVLPDFTPQGEPVYKFILLQDNYFTYAG